MPAPWPPAAVCALLFLSGCLAPAARPDSGPPEADALFASSLDVDLRESVLNITMPAGQPTMLVALNVTRDMWMRPIVGVVGVGNAPAQDVRSWTICPWVRSFGVAGGFVFRAVPFWLEGETLLPALATVIPFGRPPASDQPGGHCASDYRSDGGRTGIRADEPRDGRLALLVFAYRPVVDETGQSGVRAEAAWGHAAPPAFSLLVGVGQPCADDASRICAPESEVRVEPTVRGGPVTAAACATLGTPVSCDAALIGVTDSRQGSGPLARGRLALERSAGGAPGLAILIGNAGSGAYNGYVDPTAAGTLGRVRLQSSIGSGHGEVRTDCTTSFIGVGVLLASHEGGAVARTVVDVEGEYEVGFVLWDFPLALGHAGWSLKGAGWTTDEAGLFTLLNSPHEGCLQ